MFAATWNSFRQRSKAAPPKRRSPALGGFTASRQPGHCKQQGIHVACVEVGREVVLLHFDVCLLLLSSAPAYNGAHQSQPAFARKTGEHSTAINLVVHVQAPPAHLTLSAPPLMSCHALLGLGQSSQQAPPALPLRWQLHAACLRVTRCRYSATHTSDSLTVPQCNKMWLPCWAQDLAIACPRVHTHACNICTNQTSAEQTASPARRSAATSLHACRRPSAASSSLASASQRS